MGFVTTVISCLTGIGALTLIAIAGIGGLICFVMWRDKQEKYGTFDRRLSQRMTEALDVDWEAELDAAIERAQRDAW